MHSRTHTKIQGSKSNTYAKYFWFNNLALKNKRRNEFVVRFAHNMREAGSLETESGYWWASLFSVHKWNHFAPNDHNLLLNLDSAKLQWIFNDLNLCLILLKHKKINQILSELTIVQERPYHNFTERTLVISKTGICHYSLTVFSETDK